ncbi:Acetyl esterase/lipase [Chitinophaga sp. CF118]|uniref:alpha/beta hydrolase n=1 Tax=Chitinophaga sp. CF118 TaxID=1884367 RepID=UPI0008EF78B7|nr:alpha/beta hydrolase [Chitinophaga sp. CF118]SFE27953.1 Acetyl esterase/lipase [Chitinophaga sp. CF118]
MINIFTDEEYAYSFSKPLPVLQNRFMIRLTFTILFLLISLLAIFKAPTYHLWLLAIGVAEYAWVFATITVVLLFTGFFPGKQQLAGTLLGIITLILYLTPVIRAYSQGQHLAAAIDNTLGNDPAIQSSQPFSLTTMITGNHQKTILPQTFTYCTDTACPLHLDFYPSQAAGLRPCVIVIHGGSWSSGDSKQLPELNSYLANTGYHVASINYRLAPVYQSPLPVEDVYAAMNYLRTHSAELQIDTANFILLGRSAGAQIALLAAYRQPVPGLKGVIDFYGPADMVWGYSKPANPWVMDSRKVMENYLGGTYTAVPENYAASSPIEFVNKSSVPTLIIHGEHDVLVAYEHSTRLNKKLTENGIKHFFLSLPWANHGFDYNLNGPGGQLSTYTVERFLHNVTH